MIEYGNAIKDLVAANIFPGDMLWKNFGVTRHGKVVFYDYDEIEYLTDCNFRRCPTPRNEEEEMSGEIWYTVGPKDVFPETFGPFLLGNPAVREVFMKHHADLLDAAFWQGHKERILAGHVHDVFPYEPRKRFAHPAAHNACSLPLSLNRTEGDPPWPTPSSSSPPPARPSAACWATSPRCRLGAGRRGHQGRGRARRRARRRRRRGADGQLPDGRPGPGAGAPGDAQGRPARQSAGAVTLSKMCG